MTPQTYVQSVFDFVKTRGALTGRLKDHDLKALGLVKIEYRLEPRDPSNRRQYLAQKAIARALGGEFRLMGSTEVKTGLMFIFGRDHLHDQKEMAKTIAHEMGHILAGHKENHGPCFIAQCERLGLDAGYDPKNGDFRYSSWLDPVIEEWVDKQEEVEWDY